MTPNRWERRRDGGGAAANQEVAPGVVKRD